MEFITRDPNKNKSLKPNVSDTVKLNPKQGKMFDTSEAKRCFISQIRKSNKRDKRNQENK